MKRIIAFMFLALILLTGLSQAKSPYDQKLDYEINDHKIIHVYLIGTISNEEAAAFDDSLGQLDYLLPNGTSIYIDRHNEKLTRIKAVYRENINYGISSESPAKSGPQQIIEAMAKLKESLELNPRITTEFSANKNKK